MTVAPDLIEIYELSLQILGDELRHAYQYEVLRCGVIDCVQELLQQPTLLQHEELIEKWLREDDVALAIVTEGAVMNFSNGATEMKSGQAFIIVAQAIAALAFAPGGVKIWNQTYRATYGQKLSVFMMIDHAVARTAVEELRVAGADKLSESTRSKKRVGKSVYDLFSPRD